MIIEKKTWPDMFEDMRTGKKKFDLRVADFEVNVGDTLVLREWDPETGQYTGRELKKQVIYLLKTQDLKFNTKEEIDEHGFVIMQVE